MQSRFSTLADISIVGRPAILIPLKYAKDDHQLQCPNICQGASIVLEEGPNLTEELTKFTPILKSPSKARAMANQVLGQGKPNASKNIIKQLKHILEKKMLATRLPLNLGSIHFINWWYNVGIAEVLLNLGYSVQGSDMWHKNNQKALILGVNIYYEHKGENVNNYLL